MNKKDSKKRTTIKDVAARAGVTIGTVSHVINETATISDQTAERVREAIKELDYVPNNAARNMRVKDKKVIGLLIPKLSNNFYSGIISSFMERANRDNYIVLIVSYEYSLQKEKEAINTLIKNNVGVVIVFNGCGDEKYIRSMIDKDVGIIFADRRTDMEDVSYVQFENKKVMSDAVGYLKEKGYKKIGYISEPLSIINIKDRYDGYVEALSEHGFEFTEENVYISESFVKGHMKNGYLYTKQLLEKKERVDLPDAFIASSDSLAIGVIKAIREKGYKIPGDFGVVGCDNIDFGIYMEPSLTTIDQDRNKMEEGMWELIENHESGMKPKHITLDQKLIIRESC